MFDDWVVQVMAVMLFVMTCHHSTVQIVWYRSGCSVHGYDPTVASRPDMRFNFHRLGLSNKEGTLPRVGEVATLSQITCMRANGHEGRRLTLLKCDIEGSEWDASLADIDM